MSEQEATLDEFIQKEPSEEVEFVETAAGRIPSDWDIENVGTLCKLRNGKATNHVDIGEKQYLVYGSNGPIGSHSEPNFDGGLIFGRVGAVGEVERVYNPVWVSDNAIQATVNDRCNTEYLYYFLSKEEMSALATKTAQPLLNQSTISNVSVPSPRLSEQRKIATVLYTVDQAIEKTEEIIDKKERIKEGLIQDLFKYSIDSDRISGTSSDEKTYNKSKYGTVPDGWEVYRLNQIVPDDAPVTYGIVKPGDHHPNGVPVVKVENIYDGKVEQEGLLHTAPEKHEKYSRAELTEGDLLFTIRGTVGRMAFVPESLEGANLTQDTARIRIRDANPRFVMYYFESPTPNNYFERNTKGQAVQGINLEDLREVPVHLPPEEEQNAIVNILDSHTDQIQMEREYLKQLQRLKQGLMQDLLSGTVRTTDTNINVPDEVARHG